MRPRKELTTRELEKILRYTNSGVDYKTISVELGRHPSVIYRTICRYGKKPVLPGYRGRGYLKTYTVYDAKTKAVVANGSARDCADALGFKQTTFYEYLSRQRKGQRTKSKVVIVEGLRHDELR